MVSGWKRSLVIMTLLLASGLAAAAGGSGSPDRLQRYVIEFKDAPLASFAGGQPPSMALISGAEQLEATSPQVTGVRKLDLRSPQSRAYLNFLDQTHDAFRLEAATLLGHTIKPVDVYRNALT